MQGKVRGAKLQKEYCHKKHGLTAGQPAPGLDEVCRADAKEGNQKEP